MQLYEPQNIQTICTNLHVCVCIIPTAGSGTRPAPRYGSGEDQGSKVTHPQTGVPGRRGEGRAVRRHLDAADAVLVAEQDGDTVPLQDVPHVDGVVVVAGEEQAAWRRARDIESERERQRAREPEKQSERETESERDRVRNRERERE